MSVSLNSMYAMSLKFKIPLALLALIAIHSAVDLAIHRFVIFPRYNALERMFLQKDMDRCVEAIRREVKHLDTVTNDWAAWDDTCRFVENGDDNYIESNLGLQTFLDNRLNAIYIYDLEGKVIWGQTRDVRSGKQIRLSRFPEDKLPPTHSLLRHADSRSSIAGIMMTAHGPMIVASRPIISSDRSGPVRGVFVMGRLLDEGLVRTLIEQTRVDFQIWPIRGKQVPSRVRGVMERISKNEPYFFTEDSDNLSGYTLFPDLQEKPAILIKAILRKDVTSKVTGTMEFVTMSNLIIGFSLLAVLTWLLQLIVIKPVQALTGHARRIRNSGELSLRFPGNRGDEIGLLSCEFDHMVRELHNYHTKLRSLSSELLLAEERERHRIATELHDRIGQALTVSKIKLDTLMADVQYSADSDDLAKISALIEQAIQDSRSLTFELSPPILYEFGLESALEWLLEQLQEKHGLGVRFYKDRQAKPLSHAQQVLLFQASRELLFNIVKHAGAKAVTMSVTRDGTDIKIVIEDDGQGLELSQINTCNANNTGFGLFSIRERLRDVGGHLIIDSTKGRGTRVALASPLQPPVGG